MAVFGEAADAAAEFLVEAVQEEVRQQRDVAATLPQRRDADGEGVHAVEQVAAEDALADLLVEVGVGGGDDADIDLDLLAAADALDDLVLQEAQQLDLQGMRQVADLVEEQRAFVGALDLADGLLHRAGEGAAFVAEQFAFQQVFRDGAAVDGDERLFRARTEVVHRLGQRFLAGAAFAQQQDRNVGGGDLFDVAADLQHAGVAGDDPLDRGLDRRGDEAAVFLLQPVQVQAAFDDGAQHLDLDRFFAEIIGAGGDGAQRVLALAVAGDDDDFRLWGDPQHVGQGGEAFADAVGVGRQAEIHDGDRRAFAFHQHHGLRPRVRHQHLAGGKRPAVLGAETLIILDDQQFWLRHSASDQASAEAGSATPGRTEGRMIRIVVPASGRLNTSRSPPASRSSSRAW